MRLDVVVDAIVCGADDGRAGGVDAEAFVGKVAVRCRWRVEARVRAGKGLDVLVLWRGEVVEMGVRTVGQGVGCERKGKGALPLRHTRSYRSSGLGFWRQAERGRSMMRRDAGM